MDGFNSPPEVAQAVVGVGEKKAAGSFLNLAVLGILAGVYIGFGGQLMTIVTSDLAPIVGDGLTRFIGGAVFTVGLMLVVIGGAELWTGNNLMMTGVLAGKVGWGGLLRNWVIVYLANFVGSLFLVWIMTNTGLWKSAAGAVGARAVGIATAKCSLTWSEAFFRGIGCNWLVCLAVWLAMAGKDAVSKIFGIFFPIMAFVASGFEHSIANMYFVPMGMAIKGQEVVLSKLAPAVAEKLGNLTWGSFIAKNLIPVTIGNFVGGALFVGAIYWFTYVYKPAAAPAAAKPAAPGR